MYKEEDFIAFSLMFSDVEKNWRFSKKKIPNSLLYTIYYQSQEQGINIFHASNSEINFLKNKILEQISNKRIKEKRETILNKLFNEWLNTYVDKIDDIKIKCDENDIKIITMESKKYPTQFKNMYDFPFVIYVKGNLPSPKKSIGIVGTRNVDKIGKEFAFNCGKFLAKFKIWNVSGLAKGCDEWGHKGSLEGGGYTGAILGQGLSQPIYPKINRPLAEEILNNDGFLMSELPPDVKVNGEFLILRDRLQSAFNDAILVVETGKKGGTLHTVNYALKYGKKVYVWNPLGLGWDDNELLNNEKFQGNFILLGMKETPKNFRIRNLNKYRYFIKSIQKIDEIDDIPGIKIIIKPKEKQKLHNNIQIKIDDIIGVNHANNCRFG